MGINKGDTLYSRRKLWALVKYISLRKKLQFIRNPLKIFGIPGHNERVP